MRLPHPLTAGAVALLVGGLVAIGVGATAEPQPMPTSYEPLAADDVAGGLPQTNAAGTFDINRDFDRDLLDKQSAAQAQQTSTALAGLVRRTQAQAEQQTREDQWVLPVAGYRLTARFGQTSSLWATVHTGLDFAAPSGTTIVSVARGTVRQVSFAGAYGNRTVVELADGTEIWYCHQSATRVAPGDVVDPGQPIGNVGSTGNVTGPHLHLEVRPGGGDPVDPAAALAQHGVRV